MSEGTRLWTVGELASAGGVTVRTLHHYDELGLLAPSERSQAGYRLFDVEALRRLYRILALRGLGFSLGELADLLDADSGSLQAATRAQLERTQRQLAATEALRTRLTDLLMERERSGEASSEQLIDTMEAMNMNVKLTRIYTGLGDSGETRRGDASPATKTDPVIEAGGSVDELSAQLGFALSLPDLPSGHAEWLRRIQNDLFDLGAELSVPAAVRQPDKPHMDQGYVRWLEEICDEVNADLPPLDSFLLPGGGSYAAQMQICRTVCRRAERQALSCGEASPEALAYLNRLSDLLFILARSARSEDEILWQPWSRR